MMMSVRNLCIITPTPERMNKKGDQIEQGHKRGEKKKKEKKVENNFKERML